LISLRFFAPTTNFEMAGLVKAKQLNISDSNIAGLGTELEKQVRLNAAKTEAAWKGIGQVPGLKIWRIEKFHIADVDKATYGTFYDGDSYIILNASPSRRLTHE
jgi:gelsolin